MSAPFVQVSDLSFAYSDALSVLEGVSFRLERGITGVVGPNGAGKSTLLALLAGALRPLRGSIRRPDHARRLLQEPVLDEPIRAFAADGWAVLGRLGLDPADLDRWPTLSPGERRRWQIGAALHEAPDLLLLDEPADHLDADGRAWLTAALRRYRGIAVVVSHDRALLDEVATHTLRVADGAVCLGAGGATAALAAWEAEDRALHASLDAASEARRLARRALADARRLRDATSRSVSAGSRMKDRHDHDATTLAAGNLARQADAAAGRRVRGARAALDRAEAEADALRRPSSLGGDVSFTAAPGCRPRLVARDDLTVDRGERVRLVGPNGAGKTTLLNAALASAGLPPERVLALPQELSVERVRSDLSLLRSLPPDARGRVLQAVACLGVAPERLLASASPSPGEARKLALALGLGRGAWCLALDEPTNHLDLPSVARLEEALAGYDGAILLVSHDEVFAGRIGGRVVDVRANAQAAV